MSAPYDAIAHDYAQAKRQPWRLHCEWPTLRGLLGDPTGLSVLDLACGAGSYSRPIKRLGARRVVGVDLSPGMIDLARRVEVIDPLGIEYVIGDATTLALGERFDVVFAAYLFNYARDSAELAAMARAVVRHLRPGGRLVAANNNPEQGPGDGERYRPYGFTKVVPVAPREGSPITYTIFPEVGAPFSFDNFHLGFPAHHLAFHEAGLVEVSWHLPRVAREGEVAHGRAFWDDFLADPPVIFLTARSRG